MIKARKCSLEGISPHKIKLENTKKKASVVGHSAFFVVQLSLTWPTAGKVCSKVLTLK